MKILNTNKSTWGQVINLPIAGKTMIPGDGGEFEIDDEAGKLLVEKGHSDWTTKALIEEEKELNEDEPLKDDELKTLIAALDKMSVEELMEVAKSSNIKGYHLFKNKPEVLRTYIKNKLTK
jgi:hypothetical protein